MTLQQNYDIKSKAKLFFWAKRVDRFQKTFAERSNSFCNIADSVG